MRIIRTMIERMIITGPSSECDDALKYCKTDGYVVLNTTKTKSGGFRLEAMREVELSVRPKT